MYTCFYLILLSLFGWGFNNITMKNLQHKNPVFSNVEQMAEGSIMGKFLRNEK